MICFLIKIFLSEEICNDFLQQNNVNINKIQIFKYILFPGSNI